VDIEPLLRDMVSRNSSDLHLKVGRPSLMRLDGKLLPIGEVPLTSDDLTSMFESITSERCLKDFRETNDADFSHVVPGLARFRVNVFRRLGKIGMVLRQIPLEVPSIEALGHPAVLKELMEKKQGVLLVTGPTGSGKSTTLAAMINHINHTKNAHVITIEDPVEFVYEDDLCTINQRQIGEDVGDFKEALRRALRQDPDVILVGEMRDLETIEIAVHAAETGHLVLSTLHTNSASQTIDRILDTYPPEALKQIQSMLSLTLVAVISQRLVRKKDGSGRTAALEIMINSPNIQQLLAEGKTKDLDKAIAKSQHYYQMQTFNQSIYRLWKDDVIAEEEALQVSANPEELRLMLKGISTAGTDTENLSGVVQQLEEEERKRKDDARTSRRKRREERSEQKPKLDSGYDYY